MCKWRKGKGVHPTSGDAYFYDFCTKRQKPCEYCKERKQKDEQRKHSRNQERLDISRETR